MKNIYPLFLAMLLSHQAQASIGSHRTQVWPTLQANVKIDDLHDASAKIQPWLDLETYEKRSNAVETEAILGRKIWGLQLAGGWIMNSKAPFSEDAVAEHRALEQVTKNLDLGGTELTARFRLEERFFNHRSGVAWRAREFLRVTQPLDDAKKYSFRAYLEAFMNLNTTEVVKKTGFDQMRVFLGMLHPVCSYATLEVGYMNQTAGYATAEQVAMVHVVHLGVNLSF